MSLRCFVLPAILIAALTAQAAPTLSDAEYASVLKTVRPAPGEDKFDQVPWLISLWEARKHAATKGKPILLWEMDGHPLGCG
ncbi:MAG TPA: hypothetical protein VKD71_13395 [Gemmataceae bacterium]|nr:hypothetical protein [Gemmataceae bacterium]